MLVSAFRRFTAGPGSAAGPQMPQIERKAVAGVGRLILTIGNKGGVGKSMVTVNTALALAKTGNKVGIFDANIYSPDIPRLTGTTNWLLSPDKQQNYLPITTGGIQQVSVANVIGKKDSILWKNYVGAILGDFLKKAIWQDVDYLLVDTPPGTGDIHMALSTLFKADGAIVVTTPDALSFIDTCRCIDMLNRMPIPIVGIVENKGEQQCQTCNKITPAQNEAGKVLADKYKLQKICTIPTIPAIVDSCDNGTPAYTSIANPELKKCFDNIAAAIMKKFPKRTPEIPTYVPDTPPPQPTEFKH